MRWAIVALVLSAAGAQAQGTLTDYLAGQGCAIGPATIAGAQAHGFDRAEIEALRAEGGTQSGEWTVLSPDQCRIELPQIEADFTLDEAGALGAIEVIKGDEYSEPGCYLDGTVVQKFLTQRAGGDKEAGATAYFRFLGAHLVSGDLRFYSDSPLRTPYGFQVTTDSCADVPLMPEIQRNHEILTRHFGAFLRENAQHVPCEDGETLMSPKWHGIMERLSGGKNSNAWLSLEYYLIALGAGWVEGAGAKTKGTPRPPLCH